MSMVYKQKRGFQDADSAIAQSFAEISLEVVTEN